MGTLDIVSRIKNKIGKDSDYAVAKALGVNRQNISNYRIRNTVMSPDDALKAAEILEVNPEDIALELFAEKSKKEETKEFWKKRLKEAAIPMILMGFLSYPPSVSENKNLTHVIHYANILILKSRELLRLVLT